ncbi:RagB/SusD family nutrient uptake outer membrane protein [Gangjinia marincola]|uniref:RagB/SusD family nutrient uptake outer membrane protein n=1 Tax=Gangjinia marincola TaxID=578463 RepID=A0ABN1MHH7_9FLAO
MDVDSLNPASDNFFNTEEDYQQALIGAYDLLQTTYLNVMLGEIASDNTLAGGESATDVIGIQQIDDMIHTPSNAQLRDIWGWMFSGINRANFILEFQDKIDFAGKNEVLAQARFLRAYYYFELVKFFGDVPLVVDERVLFGDQFEVDRNPSAEVYAQIEEDLQFAADNLPVTQIQAGRITKGAALALLGKVFLYQDKFSEAIVPLENVINSGAYSLIDDYSTMFENDNENNAESVFEIQYTDKEGAGFDCLQCSEGNIAVGFNGIRNYQGPEFDSGFSFNVPTQDAFDAFEAGDVRRNEAILDIEQWADSTGATFSTGYEHTGYFNRKYIARKGDLGTGDANLTNPNNYRSIRYADVLLMAAEALNRSGQDDPKALVYVNQVRTRAGLDEISSTGASLTDAIYQERRVELVGEGHRFFDLVRTGRASTEIPGFQAGKHELFPIPQIEIELAGNRWEQNPGY